jgi:CRISPR-associated protein Cas1
MAQLTVQGRGASVVCVSERVVVRREGKDVVSRPLADLDEIVLLGDVELSAGARSRCLSKGVDVIFLSAVGRYLGRLVPPEGPDAARRVAQVRFLDGPGAAVVASRVVRAKLRNQASVLARVRDNDRARGRPELIVALRALAERAAAERDVAVLRGLEGQGAALYFRGFAAAISNEAMPFPGRNRRPPTDPVNAMLSLGYTLLLARAESALRAAGLDPTLGALHVVGRGAPALALDVIEPWRPVIVDRTVLRVVNRRQVKPEEFIDPDADAPEDPAVRAVWCGPLVREVLFRELGATWRETVADPTGAGTRPLRGALRDEAVRWVALFEGRRDDPGLLEW